MKRTSAIRSESDDRATGERPSQRRRLDGKQASTNIPSPIRQEASSQLRHRYDNTIVGGYGQAHFGDTINQYFGAAQPQADKYHILFTSLKFERMEARFRNVTSALPSTCEWLLHHELFATWTDPSRSHEHHNFLWIKGKPGSGKSTIMRETIIWAKQQRSMKTVLSYFFNARSPQLLEKSSLGLCRSLTYQLLYACPGSRPMFARRFRSKVNNNQVEDWTVNELQNFLIELITTKHLPPLNIFIDALDEGADEDGCTTDGHCPRTADLAFDDKTSVITQGQAGLSRDIEVFIRSRLVSSNNPHMAKIRDELQHRSAGIFLWVVLVVVMLNKAYDQGKSAASMLQRLKEIPRDLHDIFAQLLPKDQEDSDECVALLAWVLFSTRPLSQTELCDAIRYTCFTTDTDLDQDIHTTQDTMYRYLLNCSRGLVELTKANPPVVQFIHETVRDYLLGGNVLGERKLALCASDSPESGFQADHCHLKIAEGCLQYLVGLHRNKPWLKEPAWDSLTVYAGENWWQHAQKGKGLCSHRFLSLAMELLMDAGNLSTWVHIHDIDCSDKEFTRGKAFSFFAGMERFIEVAPPLYYAACIGVPEIILKMLALQVDINAQGGHHGTALQAAARYNHKDVVRMLLDKGADVNTQGGCYGSAMLAALRYWNMDIVTMLLERDADANTQGGLEGIALCAAACAGHRDIVAILLDRGAGVNARGCGPTALQAAAQMGEYEVVRMLLEHGADVNAHSDE